MAEAEDGKPSGGHNLADHLYGENIVHEHDEYSDHDHDHFDFDDDGPLEQNPIWQQDHVTLVSVGIDIGSAGTQVIFSRINLRRYGEDHPIGRIGTGENLAARIVNRFRQFIAVIDVFGAAFG